MTREELKAEALIDLGSEPAPKEWEKLPGIKEQMPSCIGGEVSLQRFAGTDICAWFVGIGGLWQPQSDYFRVFLPPAEGAEAYIKSRHPQDWDEIPQWHIDELNEFAALQNKSLPPAEGADADFVYHNLTQPFRRVLQSVALHGYDIVFAERDCIGVARKFATLHAQRLAEKMVEEIDDETIAWAAEHQCGTPFSERWIGFVKGAKWHRSLHAQRIADKMVEKMSPSNEQIHEAALVWAREHSNAPDKDCPDWLIRDYEAGAYFVRQCMGCWNKE